MSSLARLSCVLVTLLALCPLPFALAQEGAEPAGPDFDWQTGPTEGALGSVATITVPEGFAFTGPRGAQEFMRMTQNPVSKAEVGVVVPTETGPGGSWFVVFEYRADGYVKDDDREDLDADALLEHLREGTEAGNELRKEQGWATLELVGWERPPFYDPQSNDLTWATRGRSEGAESVNWSTRLLGRQGCMNVDLVLDAGALPTILPQFEALLAGFRFNEGMRYAEFRPGDKVATYGLTALVAGGAGALAAKTGLLAKFWKLIVVGAVAVAGAFKKLFGGRGAARTTET